MSDKIKKDIQWIKSIAKDIDEVKKDQNKLFEANKLAMKKIANSIEDQFNDEKLSEIKYKDIDASPAKVGFFKLLWNKFIK